VSDEQIFPCIRGCTHPAVDGEPVKPKTARHGLLCDSCFYRLKHALTLAPRLIFIMRTSVAPGGGMSDGQPKGRQFAPAPLGVAPVDDADALYAKLARWVDYWSGVVRVPAPKADVWTTLTEADTTGDMLGIPGGVTPKEAARLAGDLSSWLQDWLESAAYTTEVVRFHDAITYGEPGNPGVFPLQGRYSADQRPPREADRRECPICGQTDVFAMWSPTGEPKVLCGRCDWVAGNTDEVLAKLNPPNPVDALVGQVTAISAIHEQIGAGARIIIRVHPDTLDGLLPLLPIGVHQHVTLTPDSTLIVGAAQLRNPDRSLKEALLALTKREKAA